MVQTMVAAEPNVGVHGGQEWAVLVDGLVEDVDLNTADGCLAMEERDAFFGKILEHPIEQI